MEFTELVEGVSRIYEAGFIHNERGCDE